MIENCRALLLAKRLELLRRRPTKFDMLAQAGHPPPEDQAMILHDEFVAIRLTNWERETLKLVDTALAKLHSGDYGICVECERPISPKRLQAIPWASRCIRCEERICSGPDQVEVNDRAA